MNYGLRQMAMIGMLCGLAACGGDSQPLAESPSPPPPPADVTPIWLKGDLHVHDDHSSDGSAPRQLADDRGPGNVAIQDQISFARLSGLDFLPLTDHRTYDQHYDPNWESGDLLLIPGEEANGSPHATVHGAVDTVVQGADDGDNGDLRRLQQSIWFAHSQGAVWVTAHPDDGAVEDDGSPNARASAVGVDLVETWNRASNIEKEIDYAEHRWNAGYRFGIAGGSDNHFREIWLLAGPGLPTTEVYAAGRSERGILQGLRDGRTRLYADAASPIVNLEADFDGDGVFEATGGDEVIAPLGQKGQLRINVDRGMGTSVLLYAAPGRSAGPLATFSPSLLELQSSYLVDVEAPAEGWYRVEVRGLSLPHSFDTSEIPTSIVPMPQELPNQLRAATSPIFVSTAAAVAQPEVPIPVDSGVDEGARWVLGGTAAFSGFADLAVSTGYRHVVAEIHEPGVTRVQYRRGSGDQWDAPLTLSDSGSARFPQVAALGNQVWVVWQDEAGGQQPRRPSIRMRRSEDAGVTWSAIDTLRAPDGRAEHPAIAVTPSAEAVVVWQEIRAGEPFDVYAQVLGRDAEPINLSRSGKSIQAAHPLDTRSARYPASVWPQVAVASDGRIAVGWQDNRTDPDPLWTGQSLTGEGTDPDNWQIGLRLRSAGASDWGELHSLGADDAADRHPDVAFTGDGRWVIAWESKPLRSSGVNLEIRAAQELADGSASEPTPLAPSAHGMGQFVRLGPGADGDVLAVWADSRADDWRWRVMHARLEQGQWAAAELISAPGNNTWPATAQGEIVFASTRRALRLQRDPTQQIYWLPAR